ncbi:MAG: S8 family serine peptidase [Bacteroidota bacterium]
MRNFRSLCLLLLIAFVFPLNAQKNKVLPPAKSIDKEYRKEYKKDRRYNRKDIKELKNDQWDIILPPEEQVPVQQFSQLDPANTDNWGVRLLLPKSVRERIRIECKYKVRLKIADTGVDLDHPDLIGSWRIPGTNYTTSNTIDDVQGHGTHVAGIATARGFGIAYELARMDLLELQSVKILGDRGQGSFVSVANAFRTERPSDVKFIEEGGAIVYNGSFGGGNSVVSVVDEELRKSTQEGIVFVFASGNDDGPVNYPGLSKYAITTASLDPSLVRSSYSNYGPEVTLSMPGRNITSTYTNGGYATLSGTSMSSPFNAGIICLALSRWGMEKLPNYTYVRDYIEEIADDLGEEGFDDFYGAGIAYVLAVLETDPDRIFDGQPPVDENPDEEDPVNEEPIAGPAVTVSKDLHRPIIFRYRTESEHENGGGKSMIGWHVVTIPYFRCITTAPGGYSIAHDKLVEEFEDYFYHTGKVMVIPDGDSAADVIRYIPMFFYYHTRNHKSQPVFTEEIRGVDEQGREYYFRLTDSKRGGVPILKESEIKAKVIYTKY